MRLHYRVPGLARSKYSLGDPHRVLALLTTHVAHARKLADAHALTHEAVPVFKLESGAMRRLALDVRFGSCVDGALWSRVFLAICAWSGASHVSGLLVRCS